MRKTIGNQGEVRVDMIGEIPDIKVEEFKDKNKKGYIISHSEQGHHHILGGNVEVLERVENVAEGMRVLYAIVKEPTNLFQDAPTPHDHIDLAEGIYEFRIKREYNPFLEEAMRVSD